MVVVKDGKIVADWTFDKPAGPIEAMSATKSVVNLAIGRTDRPEERSNRSTSRFLTSILSGSKAGSARSPSGNF